MKTYHSVDPHFVDKFLPSIYVDDLVAGVADVSSVFEFYKKSRQRLAVAGLRLRKFVSNSEELQRLIRQDEALSEDGGAGRLPDPKPRGEGVEDTGHVEEDLSYAKTSLGVENDEQRGVHKVLGIQWNVSNDDFRFDIQEVATVMESSEPMKRGVVSATAKFFDPLGIVSPVTVLFKMFAQQLCEARVGWDELLTGDLLRRWEYLLTMLRDAKAMEIPRPLCPSTVQSVKLVGFCDASSKAYVAIVYLRVEDEAQQVNAKFVAAKTRVAPVGGATIPRLELLSTLLLAKLINSVRMALEGELQLGDPTCYSDSKVALFWIRGTSQEWKQFVENRVNTIRNLLPPQYRKHCPGKENPADIPSRGMSASELADTPLWLHGPDWLCYGEEREEESDPTPSVPEGCRGEMKKRDQVHLLTAAQDHSTGCLSQLIDPGRYSSAYRLFKVTGLVLKFVRCLRERVSAAAPDSPANVPPPPPPERH